ncbi:MAG: hypothetical protein ACYC9L_16500 [Sulfuricaulis sp.]
MVLYTSAAAAAVVACVVLTPWIKITAADAHAEKVKTIYASGLIPCGPHTDELETLLHTYQPEMATLEIREFPTLANEAHIVQIAGGHLYSFDFKPLYKESNEGRPELHTEVAPKIAVADISTEARKELSLLVAADIRHAQPRELTVVDGVAYVFSVPGVGCAYTNSPNSATRAGKLTDLYFTLLKHATTTNPSALQESNRNILAAVRALQVK